MTRLLLSTAALAMIAAPAMAEAKRPHPALAKQKVVKTAQKTTTATTVKAK